MLSAHCMAGNTSTHSETARRCSKRIERKRTDYFLHHPLARAVGPRRVCDSELMVNTQGFAQAGQNRVLEMRGGITHPHTQEPQSLTPCKQRRSSRFGGTNLHRLHPHEVAKIIHDNQDVPKTTILGQTLRSLRATLAHMQKSQNALLHSARPRGPSHRADGE